MSTKECPSCGTIVPESAARCKECFHDFTEDEPQSRSSSGILMVLGAFAAMAVVGSGVLWYITSTPTEERILVDQDTRSVVWTRKYRSGIETDRLRFDDVIRLEYVLKATGHYEIAGRHRGGRPQGHPRGRPAAPCRGQQVQGSHGDRPQGNRQHQRIPQARRGVTESP